MEANAGTMERAPSACRRVSGGAEDGAGPDIRPCTGTEAGGGA